MCELVGHNVVRGAAAAGSDDMPRASRESGGYLLNGRKEARVCVEA